MSKLDELVKNIGPSIILPGIAAASLPPRYRQMIERAQEIEIATIELGRRLEGDRQLYGITEEEQAKLLKTGWYETALALIATAPTKTAYTASGGPVS